jgi:hypothetical protein
MTAGPIREADRRRPIPHRHRNRGESVTVTFPPAHAWVRHSAPEETVPVVPVSPLYNDEGRCLNASEATGSTGRHVQDRPDGPVGNLVFMAAPGAEMSSPLLVVLDAPERADSRV